MLIGLGMDQFEGSMLVDRLGGMAEAGIQHAIVGLPNIWDLEAIETIARDVIPQVAKL